MNETQLWYCNLCNKTINNESKSKHIISETHKHKKEYGIVVKENNFFSTRN